MSSSQIAAGSAVVLTSTVSTGGNNAGRGTNWLPPAMQPIGTCVVTMPDGSKQTLQVQIDPQYYKFLDEMANRRLAGVAGPTLTAVNANAAASLDAVTSVTQVASLISQQADASAAAASAVKQVLVASDVPGATQIPDVPRAINRGNQR